MRQFLIVALVLCVSTVACAKPVGFDKAHKASLHTAQHTILGGAQCSATAIGPQALLTASHCEEPTDTLYVEGFDTPATIIQIIRDGADHSIYLLKNITFKDYVDVDVKSLGQGDDVYFFGNPGDYTDMYRRGYVSGFENQDALSEILSGQHKPRAVLFDLPDFHGDSGSGIFDVQTGKLISVVSTHLAQKDEAGYQSIRFTGGFELAFTQDQLNRARNFMIGDDPKPPTRKPLIEELKEQQEK